MQSDALTIVSLSNHIESLKIQLNGLQQKDLTGGWAERFKESLVEEGDKIFLKGFEMLTPFGTRLTGQKDFNQIRRDVLRILLDCLQNRFEHDENLMKIIKPFIEFQAEANIRQIHEIFGADLALSSLSLEYTELLESKVNDSNLSKQLKTLLKSSDSSNYKCVITILSRINACTPQSADVERLIKSNNLLKTSFRANLSLKTENKYMYVYYNMPTLEKWNPKKAINIWLNDKQRREHIDIIQKDSAKKTIIFQRHF